MQYIIMECKGHCRRRVHVAAESLAYDGFTTVSQCPICHSYDVKRVGGPWEIDFPKIKIKNVAKVVNKPQPAILPVGQLHSSGRGDDEPGEGAPQELEEPSIDGVIQPRTFPPNTPEQYQAEEKRALGI